MVAIVHRGHHLFIFIDVFPQESQFLDCLKFIKPASYLNEELFKEIKMNFRNENHVISAINL